MLKARGEMDSEAGKQWLLQEELTTGAEWQMMVSGDRQHSVISWMVILFAKAVEVFSFLQYRVNWSVGYSVMNQCNSNDIFSDITQ